MKNTNPQKPLIVFDGICVLCAWSMRLILFADKNKKNFDFATTQSDLGQKHLKENNLSTDNFETVLLIMANGEVYKKLNMVVEVGKRLGGIWNMLRIFKILPQKQRDGLYDFVATRRYKWFGKTEYCKRIPTEYQDRIIR